MNLNTPIQFIDNFSCCDFKQVERVFGASHPDPLEIEKAKKVLKVRSAVFVFLVVLPIDPMTSSAVKKCLHY